MKIPVFRAFFAGLALLIGHAGAHLRALWLPALIMLGVMAAIMPGYIDMMVQFAEMESSADPSEVIAMMQPAARQGGILYLAMAVFYPMLVAGNLKYIVRGQSGALPFYLQYGYDELRIVITFILFVVMTGLAYVVGALGLVVMAILFSLLSPAVSGAVSGAAALAALIAFLWFLLRLSLMFPATIDTRKIGVTQSWRVTKGNSVRLLFYWLLWLVVFTFLAAAYVLAAFPAFFSLLQEFIAAAASGPEAAGAFQSRWMEMQRDLWDRSTPGFWVYMAATYVYMIAGAAIWNVASGVAYRYATAEQRP